MGADHFIDTNILIYHLDTSNARKHQRVEAIVRNALTTRQGCISTQVAGCRVLFSEDLQDDQDLDGLRVVNRFL